MTEDSLKDKKELLISIVIVICVILASTLIYFYWSDEPDNGHQPIDRSINFPKDEGLHDETFERWTFFGTLNTDDGDEFEILIRWLKQINEDQVQIEYFLRDNDNLTETTSYEISTRGNLEGADDELDFELTGNNKLTTMKSTESFTYQFSTEIDTSMQMTLDINSNKNPVLFGDDGRLYRPDFGTVFGYYQSQLALDGTLIVPEIGEIHVEGKGWLEHIWGGEIKSLLSETWHIHLDNSVEIYITKMYERTPEISYPDDLFLYVVNIVRTDGRLLTPELMADIYMENMDYRKYGESYLPEPVDRYEYYAWSSEWRLYNNDMDITISLDGDSIKNNIYIGFIEAEGYYMGQYVTGQGASELNYRYKSYPSIDELVDNFNALQPLEPVTVYADISYIPPIDITEIYLDYRVDDGDWIRTNMELTEEGYWGAIIPSQNYGSTVEYQVVVIDMIDHTVKSQIASYYIDYV